jgi:hypothetical protein
MSLALFKKMQMKLKSTKVLLRFHGATRTPDNGEDFCELWRSGEN